MRAFSLDPVLDQLGYGLLSDGTIVAEVLQVREQMEAAFVMLVARSVTPDQLRVLRTAVDQIGERAARGRGTRTRTASSTGRCTPGWATASSSSSWTSSGRCTGACARPPGSSPTTTRWGRGRTTGASWRTL